MKNEKLKEFKEELDGWINFNKNRGSLDLLDVSKLLTIFRRYFVVYLKKGNK